MHPLALHRVASVPLPSHSAFSGGASGASVLYPLPHGRAFGSWFLSSFTVLLAPPDTHALPGSLLLHSSFASCNLEGSLPFVTPTLFKTVVALFQMEHCFGLAVLVDAAQPCPSVLGVSPLQTHGRLLLLRSPLAALLLAALGVLLVSYTLWPFPGCVRSADFPATSRLQPALCPRCPCSHVPLTVLGTDSQIPFRFTRFVVRSCTLLPRSLHCPGRADEVRSAACPRLSDAPSL